MSVYVTFTSFYIHPLMLDTHLQGYSPGVTLQMSYIYQSFLDSKQICGELYFTTYQHINNILVLNGKWIFIWESCGVSTGLSPAGYVVLFPKSFEFFRLVNLSVCFLNMIRYPRPVWEGSLSPTKKRRFPL